MIDNQNIKKILQISDEELNDKISEAVKSTGMDLKTNITPDVLEKIKSTVSKMSEKDISNLLSSVPTEKIAEIRNIVDKKN